MIQDQESRSGEERKGPPKAKRLFAPLYDFLLYSDASGTAVKVWGHLHRTQERRPDAKNYGWSNQSRAQIAKALHIGSLHTVDAALDELVAHGFVAKVSRNRAASLFRALEAPAAVVEQGASRAENAPDELGQKMPQARAESAPDDPKLGQKVDHSLRKEEIRRGREPRSVMEPAAQFQAPPPKNISQQNFPQEHEDLPTATPRRFDACEKHQSVIGKLGPCWDCRDAKKANEAVAQKQDSQAKRAAAEKARAEQQAVVRVRQQQISACTLCDEKGYADKRVCDHDPERNVKTANGIAMLRAALDAEKHAATTATPIGAHHA